jgi:hypothetical protein
VSFDLIFLQPFAEAVEKAKPAVNDVKAVDATSDHQPEADVSTETEVPDGLNN